MIFSSGAKTRNFLSTALWVPVGLVFTSHLYSLKFVRGRSMQPTLNPEPLIWNDLALFDRLSIQIYHEYERGDIVALWSPSHVNLLIVKRIIALEGDMVKTLPPYPDAEVRIPEGHAWVEGDESFHTMDSNTFGPVPLGLVDSKLLFLLWPMHRFGRIPHVKKVVNHRVMQKE